ncbi:hypothetical protein ACFSJY_10935 [Thalassotalea euphylliae]|uniref:hypothetical protein n=1 Tax=Thalassotalea euphylliae TaxID=1655234 RepID=UPI00363A7803
MSNINNNSLNVALVLGACFCFVAAGLHLACIVFGPSWYLAMGAGEDMARMAGQGELYPSIVTSVIATILCIWGYIALAGAGAVRRLPFQKLALVMISGVFLFRGAGAVLIMPMFPGNSLLFWVVSSAICLIIGACFAIGIKQQWRVL